jgi:hypothetical protein
MTEAYDGSQVVGMDLRRRSGPADHSHTYRTKGLFVQVDKLVPAFAIRSSMRKTRGNADPRASNEL